jgi:hypothetical protein
MQAPRSLVPVNAQITFERGAVHVRVAQPAPRCCCRSILPLFPSDGGQIAGVTMLRAN